MSDEIYVHESVYDIVDWFMDVMPHVPVHQLKHKRVLGLPTAEVMVASAQLIRFDYARTDYDSLLSMINAARRAFN